MLYKNALQEIEQIYRWLSIQKTDRDHRTKQGKSSTIPKVDVHGEKEITHRMEITLVSSYEIHLNSTPDAASVNVASPSRISC